MTERVWTVVEGPAGQWEVQHDGRSTGQFETQELAVEHALAAARRASADLYKAVVLVDDRAGLREIFPRRHKVPSSARTPEARGRRSKADVQADGYSPGYLADKFRIPQAAAKRIIDRCGNDRAKLNAAAKAYKAKGLP